MRSAAEIAADLKEAQAQKAQVLDQMAPYLMRRKAVREAIHAECFKTCDQLKVVKSWSTMGASNIARLDEVNASAAAALSELKPRLDVLKEAVRTLEIDLKRAQQERGKNAEKTRKTAFQNFPRLTPGPLKGKRNAERVSAFPNPLTRRNAENIRFPSRGPEPQQGGLFDD